MQLESIALEALDREAFAINEHQFLWTNGKSEDRQTTVLFPKFGDAPVHALIRFGEAALGCVGR
jgi:hypothetical protein